MSKKILRLMAMHHHALSNSLENLGEGLSERTPRCQVYINLARGSSNTHDAGGLTLSPDMRPVEG